MVIVWAISWWYGAGWLEQLAKLKERLVAAYDYFSIGLLARTLFAPFRQISAGRVDGSLGMRWRAFIDKLLSRFIGASVRLVLIIAGTVWISLQAIFGVLIVVLWAFVPLLPLIGLIMTLSGWVPSWR